MVRSICKWHSIWNRDPGKGSTWNLLKEMNEKFELKQNFTSYEYSLLLISKVISISLILVRYRLRY